MTDIELKNNEEKYIEFIIEDYNGERFDLSSINATIQLKKYGDTTLSVDTACLVTNPTNGICKWLYDGALSVGEYEAEIELTIDDLRYITPSFDIKIIASV